MNLKNVVKRVTKMENLLFEIFIEQEYYIYLICLVFGFVILYMQSRY